jgi:hypothetical protein
MAGKIDDVLAGAAAEFKCIAGFSGEKPQQHRTDRLMIAVKGRGVEPPVGLNGSAIPAEFNAIFRHAGSCRSPDREVDLTRRTANRKAGWIEADN